MTGTLPAAIRAHIFTAQVATVYQSSGGVTAGLSVVAMARMNLMSSTATKVRKTANVRVTYHCYLVPATQTEIFKGILNIFVNFTLNKI